jgi:CubicO group peptidase (beta-lactamase class C family)
VTEPTGENWLEPPFNRVGFHRVSELTTTVDIPTGDSAPLPLGRQPKSFDHLRIYSSGQFLDLQTWMEATSTDGLLVIHDGAIVLEEYRGSMIETDRHLLMSVSKSITSLLGGVLTSAGLLDTSDAVTDHLTELLGTSWDGCTIQHLLDMTAGVAWDYDRDEVDIMDVSGYRRTARSVPHADTLAWITNIKPYGHHGDSMQYISLVTDVLGWVLERAADQRLETLISEYIWQPIGAESDASLIVDRSGFRVAEGGISATLRDVGRLGQMCLNNGSAGGRQVVPAKWLGRLRLPHHDLRTIYRESAEYDPSNPHTFYHDNWWVHDAEAGCYSAIGINGQRLAVDHRTNTVIVKLSSQPEMEDPVIVGLDNLGITAIQSSFAPA